MVQAAEVQTPTTRSNNGGIARPQITRGAIMIGDCKECGHSIMYHVPFTGCIKCSCDEFSAYLRRTIRRFVRFGR